jgi:hypothetical protein
MIKEILIGIIGIITILLVYQIYKLVEDRFLNR